MRPAPDRIRNVALVGHRGSGKTSLHEALLFEASVLDRLGTVTQANTASDCDAEEQARQMSISLSLSASWWREHKVNLIDTPGEPSFVADALAALRVCESAIFVLNAVAGVEATTARLWTRAAELDVARLIFVNMLDRERADFFATVASLKQAFGPHAIATEIPLGTEEVEGVIDLLDMTAFRQRSSARQDFQEIPIPDSQLEMASSYRERLMDEVCEVSDLLMERYLDGEKISHEEIAAALKQGTNHGKLFPVTCGVATGNLGTSRLLDAIVEDLPSPVSHGPLRIGEVQLSASEQDELFAYAFKTRADPYAGRLNLVRVYQGVLQHYTHAHNPRSRTRERIGQPIVFAGKTGEHVPEIGPGDMGVVAKLKDTRAGDWLAGHERETLEMPYPSLPSPVMSFAVQATGTNQEDKVFSSLRRLREEDPTIDLHRDLQTGEQIVAGLSQVHVEVLVERLRSRFGVEVSLKPPRVPYQETIRVPAKGRGRHKKQTGGHGQFGACEIEIAPLPQGAGCQFVNQIKGGAIPSQFIPGVEKGVLEAMAAGPVAGYPVKDLQVTLLEGSFHSVDSSELAFKLAGALAMKDALAQARPVLMEPIMHVCVSVPEERLGETIADLNIRRGRPQGMEPKGATTEIEAEVPLAEMLDYAPDLRSITQGQGDYTLELLRYQPAPSQLAKRVLDRLEGERAGAHA